MAAFSSIIAAVGVAASVAGTVVGMVGAQKQAKAQRQALAAQQRAEDARRRQMDLESLRSKRQAVRDQQKARAVAMSNATQQGAQGGSGLQGGLAQIGGQTRTNMVGINQNTQLGNRVFDANADANTANQAYASAGGMVGFGSGLSSLGGALVRNSGTIGRIVGTG